MIKKLYVAQIQIVCDSKKLVLNPATGKRLIVPKQVSRKPKSIGSYVKRIDHYPRGEKHD